MITITVNGRRREMEAQTPLLELVRSTGANLQFVAVALNGDVVDKERFADVALNDGDIVEIVRPVGGG